MKTLNGSGSTGSNGGAPAIVPTGGKPVVYRPLDARQRAVQAADWMELAPGKRPPLYVVAAAFNVSIPYIRFALRCTSEQRDEILAGRDQRPFHKKRCKPAGDGPVVELKRQLELSLEHELEVLARKAGAEKTLAAAVKAEQAEQHRTT